MKVEFPEGYEYIETPREKTRRIRAEGNERFNKAKDSGVHVRRADYGRLMVYRSERAALNNIPARVYDMTLEEISEVSNKIFADKRVKKIDPYPGEIVHVQDSCIRGAIAYPFQRRMRFGTAKNNFTLYHEAAHILTPGDKHGFEFCRVMCLLIEWFENPEAAEYMRRYLR